MPHAHTQSCIGTWDPSAAEAGTTLAPHRLTLLAERLAHTLALARALALGGRTLDLTGVDDGVGMLCAQTLDLPTQQARTFLPALIGVLRQLDQLSAALHGRTGVADGS